MLHTSRPTVIRSVGLLAAVMLLSGCLDLPSAGDGAVPAAPVAEDAAAAPAGLPDDIQLGRVDAHVDGDTLWIAIDQPSDARGALPAGDRYRVRILLVDTPETVHPDRDVECGGPEASTATAALLPVGAPVWIAPDVELFDIYDRPLRYVWSGSGVSLEEHLLTAGLAEVAHYPPNDRELDRYRALEAAARDAGAGIHGELGCG